MGMIRNLTVAGVLALGVLTGCEPVPNPQSEPTTGPTFRADHHRNEANCRRAIAEMDPPSKKTANRPRLPNGRPVEPAPPAEIEERVAACVRGND